MASGDFLDLQTNLAILAGRATAAELDEDLALCKQCINEALLEVYRPVDGRYPEWARRTVALNYRAPLAINVGVTNGSRIVTGYAFPADCVGSLVQIGAAFYRYAGASSTVHYLVEPFNESTGTYAATLHHVSQPLPADVAEVVGGVEWMGRGLLAAMTDRETDVGYRSVALPDYYPDYGAGFWGTYSPGVRGTAYPQGDLLFYYVETDALLDGAEVLRRMNIVPMPREAANVSFRANIVPVELSADTDRPKVVADLVTRCLLPIAREIWGITYKKYTGDNRDALIRQADKARAILTGMAKPQKRFSGRGGIDAPLAPLGEAQAQALAREVAARGGIERIVSSPLLRTRQTAQGPPADGGVPAEGVGGTLCLLPLQQLRLARDGQPRQCGT
jgi:hypothetical protein